FFVVKKTFFLPRNKPQAAASRDQHDQGHTSRDQGPRTRDVNRSLGTAFRTVWDGTVAGRSRTVPDRLLLLEVGRSRTVPPGQSQWDRCHSMQTSSMHGTPFVHGSWSLML